MIILQQGTQGKGGRMTEVAGAQELGKEGLLDAYRVMRTIREFEERLHTEFATGDIPGFVHLYAGEEAIAAGVCAHLDDEDDGASQGTTLESLNLASVWNLPCVFVIENNGYGEATPTSYAAGEADLVKRADGFGMPGITVDGHDFFAVFETAGEGVP